MTFRFGSIQSSQVANGPELPLTPVLAVVLCPDVEAPARARQFAASVCRTNHVAPGDCETTLLLVSELVTNVVRHAGTLASMLLYSTPERLRVEVTDTDIGSDPFFAPGVSGAAAPSGRGLQIVDRLAAKWGVERTRADKTVWFEVLRSGLP
jgi:anti-sigma regulatory factor (Ser/Thr protein kinase)